MARGTPAEPYKGIQFERVHPLIGNLAIKPEGGTDHDFLAKCKRRPTQGGYSLDDLFDALEVDDVGRSWRDAYQANAELAAAKGS